MDDTIDIDSSPSPPLPQPFPQPSFIFEHEEDFHTYAKAPQESKENNTPLPIECWQRIVCFLPLMDQLKCMKVSSMFRDVAINLLKTRTKLVHTVRTDYSHDPMNTTDEYLFRKKADMKLHTLIKFMPLLESLEVDFIPGDRLEGSIKQEDFEKLKSLKIIGNFNGKEDKFGGFLEDLFRYALNLKVLVFQVDQMRVSERRFDLFKIQLNKLIFNQPYTAKVEDELVLSSILSKILKYSRESLEVLDMVSLQIISCNSPFQPIIEQISQFKNLRELNIPLCGISETAGCDKSPDEPTHLSHLASLTRLEKLNIVSNLCLHDVDIANIVQGCKNIRGLGVGRISWKSAHSHHNTFGRPSNIYKHDDVNLPTPPGILQIGDIEHLEELILGELDLTHVNMEGLATKLENLKGLLIFNCNFPLTAFSGIAKGLSSIQNVSIVTSTSALCGWLASEESRSQFEDVIAKFYNYALERNTERIDLFAGIKEFDEKYDELSGWSEHLSEKYDCSKFFFHFGRIPI